MILGIVVFLLIAAWWLTGSYWPILPMWFFAYMVIRFTAYAEVDRGTGHILTAVACAVVVAVAPRVIRNLIRQHRVAASGQRDAAFQSFGSRILDDLAGVPKGRG